MFSRMRQSHENRKWVSAVCCRAGSRPFATEILSSQESEIIPGLCGGIIECQVHRSLEFRAKTKCKKRHHYSYSPPSSLAGSLTTSGTSAPEFPSSPSCQQVLELQHVSIIDPTIHKRLLVRRHPTQNKTSSMRCCCCYER
jgi:hypothetical protein